jgi:hypothetical protein
MMRLSRIVFLFPIFFLVLYACSSNDDFTIGDELVSVSTDVIYSDTSTLRFYTIIQDSVKTSGTEKALVGRYSDGNFGTITSTSFFQVGAPSFSTLNTDASFDSITLSLYSSGYSYGDTTKLFTIEVRKVESVLSENLDNNGYRYNVDSVLYNQDTLIGAKIFEVRPKYKRRLDITLSQEFGKKLFSMAMRKDMYITNSTYFIQYLKGIALVGNNPANQCVMSFSVDDSSYMRIYYHAGGTTDPEARMDFMIINTDYQFNHIVANRGNSPLKVLTGEDDMIMSTLCNNESYCQGGFGMMTKIEMPYLRKLVENNDKIKILKAELILSPVSGTYQTVSLPSSLALYSIDEANVLGSTVINSSGSSVTPTLKIDYRYSANTQYVFDITYYIASTLTETTTNIPGVAVTVPSSLYYNTLERAIFGDRLRSSNISKLKIWYWQY